MSNRYHIIDVLSTRSWYTFIFFTSPLQLLGFRKLWPDSREGPLAQEQHPKEEHRLKRTPRRVHRHPTAHRRRPPRSPPPTPAPSEGRRCPELGAARAPPRTAAASPGDWCRAPRLGVRATRARGAGVTIVPAAYAEEAGREARGEPDGRQLRSRSDGVETRRINGLVGVCIGSSSSLLRVVTGPSSASPRLLRCLQRVRRRPRPLLLYYRHLLGGETPQL